MKNTEIRALIVEGQEELGLISGLKRKYLQEILATIGSKPIKIVTGFRRSGKSFLVQQVAGALIEKKVFKKEQVLYLNFEDYRLAEINDAYKLAELVDLFLSMQDQVPERNLLIFDEIQNVTNWDKFIRTIYEKNHNNRFEIIITGSNSELLSSELSSNLAGRFLEWHILPFSFKEFLEFKNIHIKSDRDFIKNKVEILKGFHEYMTYGGLPETFSISEPKAKISYLSGIVSKVILDDLIARFKPKHPELLEKLLAYLVMNVGNIISPTVIAKYLKSQNVEIDINSLIKYIDYIPKTFAVYEVKKFDWKNKKVFNTSKKYYTVDLGLTSFYQGATNNFSKRLENLVFLELSYRKGFKAINYGFSLNKEIDLILLEERSRITKIQITEALNAENQERELASFRSDDKFISAGTNLLLSLDDNEELMVNGQNKIQRQNLLKWILLD